jgi:hypothetical protein
VEGGIATTIDLQTVSPLKYSGRQASLKADALYYEIGRDVPGASKTAPRLGGIYIDQFDDRNWAWHWPSAIRTSLPCRRTSSTGALMKTTRAI